MQPLTRWLDTNLMPHAVRVADCVIADSANTAKDVLAEMPYAQGKTHIVPLGVSLLTESQSRASLNSLGLQNPFFLFVGTLEPRKNLARLLEAFSTLPEPIKNTVTVAIAGGKGWGGVEISAIAEKLGIANQVRILGYVNDEQLATLYTHALLLAMPSVYEGFGLPLLEAMSRGTPVLTANCASMPEVAGDSGLLLNPHEIAYIADGLLKILVNVKYRKELAVQSLHQAQLFSWEKSAQETMQIFKSAMMSRRLK
jgi:glycosyltransferase involved in cell wall biosynthesis